MTNNLGRIVIMTDGDATTLFQVVSVRDGDGEALATEDYDPVQVLTAAMANSGQTIEESPSVNTGE